MSTPQEDLKQQAQALAKRINESEGLRNALLKQVLAKNPALQKQYEIIQQPKQGALTDNLPLKNEFDVARKWVMAKIFHEIVLQPEKEAQKQFFEQMEENKLKLAQEQEITPTVDSAMQELEDAATVEGVDWSDWPEDKIRGIMEMTDDPSLPDFGKDAEEAVEKLADIVEGVEQHELFEDQLIFISPYGPAGVREEESAQKTLESLRTFNQEHGVTEKRKGPTPFEMKPPGPGER